MQTFKKLPMKQPNTKTIKNEKNWLILFRWISLVAADIDVKRYCNRVYAALKPSARFFTVNVMPAYS